MALNTKYITKDDYKMYWGEDLVNRFKDDDNPSNKADALLYRVEQRLSAYINARFYRNVDTEYPTFTDFQKEHYKLALLEQVFYILRNSDISTDSGYDVDAGEVMNIEHLKNIIIAPNCKDQLMLCGLWCRKIKNRARGGLSEWWMY